MWVLSIFIGRIWTEEKRKKRRSKKKTRNVVGDDAVGTHTAVGAVNEDYNNWRQRQTKIKREKRNEFCFLWQAILRLFSDNVGAHTAHTSPRYSFTRSRLHWMRLRNIGKLVSYTTSHIYFYFTLKFIHSTALPRYVREYVDDVFGTKNCAINS